MEPRTFEHSTENPRKVDQLQTGLYDGEDVLPRKEI